MGQPQHHDHASLYYTKNDSDAQTPGHLRRWNTEQIRPDGFHDNENTYTPCNSRRQSYSPLTTRRSSVTAAIHSYRRRASTLLTNLAASQSSGYVEIEEEKQGFSVTSEVLSIYNESSEDETASDPPVTTCNEIIQDISRFTSSVTLVEDENPHEAEVILPEKKHVGFIRRLRWSLVTVYHRLNIMIVMPNIVAMLILGFQGRILSEPNILSLAVSVNVTISIIIRQDHVINLLFWIFGQIPHSTPLFLRRLATKLYHLGGIHSGAGMAATIWFGSYTAALAKEMVIKPHRTTLDFVMMFITTLMCCLLIQIIITSHPRFRDRWHNVWERVHRFAGWLMLLLFWLQFMVNVAAEHETNPTKPVALIIFASPNFYLLSASTSSIVLPWCALYKATVTTEHLSKHAIRLHFSYASIGPCKTPRFADTPATEWHSFASIPNPEGPGFSVIVSRAGDWTSRVIDSPPTHLWTRGTPARGALYMAKLFRKVVLVATGSGIAPILGAVQMTGTEFHILWSAPTPETTFTEVVPRMVRDADPNALIWDTKKRGRPDLIREAYRMYIESNAEAVFIISNAKVTGMFVYGLESRGVPTYAPIFDS